MIEVIPMVKPGDGATAGNAPGMPPRRAPRRTIRVDEMLEGATEAVLVHAGEEYRLRITRNGKLILTK